MTIVWVALGGALGAPLRFWLGKHWDGRLHKGTLVANTVASLLLGAVVGGALDGGAEAFVAAGFCGGLSTYSSLAVQARDLGPARGTTYVVVTVVLGLAAAALGYAVTAQA